MLTNFWAGDRIKSRAQISVVVRNSRLFTFAEGIYCGEPVFAPGPGWSYDPVSGREPGWLLTDAYDGHARRSFLAVLDAGRLQEGPVARVNLTHHMPFSMHDLWRSWT